MKPIRLRNASKGNMITELYLAHYKSVTEQTIDFRSINVLVGKNGSGKSNIIDALSFLSDVANDDLDYAITKRHGADSVRQWSKYKPYHVTIQVRVEGRDGGHGLYRIVFSSSRNNYRIQEEFLEWSGTSQFFDDRPHSTSIRRDSDSSITYNSTYKEEHVERSESSDEERTSKIRLEPGESLIHYLLSTYLDARFLLEPVIDEVRVFSIFAIFPNTIRSPQTVSRAAELDTDGKNIASIIKQMTGERRRGRDRIIKALRVVMPQLSGISIRSTAGYYVPVFSVTDPTGETHELNMSQISDGTLRMLGILTALHQPQAPLKVALEEPEQMVHPALLIIIRDAVLEFTRRRKNGQVFITTHSSVLMDLFNVEDVLAVEYSKGSTRCSRVSKRQANIVKSGLMSLGEILLAEDLEVA
jgi:predicted ATPase